MATAATDARPPLSTATNEQPTTIVAAATTTIFSTVSTAAVAAGNEAEDNMPPSNHSPASSTGSPAVSGPCGDTTASSPTAVSEHSKTGLSRQQQLTPPPLSSSHQQQPQTQSHSSTSQRTMGAAACTTTATAATATSTGSSTTATTTPLRRTGHHHQPANNYAAPHTPIASAKRPSHSSRRSLGGGTGGGRSAAKTATGGAAGGSDGRAATHTPPPPPRPDDENAAPEVLSPLHPPRPVKRDSHHVAGCPHQVEGHDHMGGKGDEEGDDLDRSWVGRKVDAIFSPVLNFLGHGSHDDEDEAAAKDGQEKAAEKDADGDVTMVDYCDDDAGADSNQVVEASLAANATSTSTATMTTVATSTTSASSEAADDVASTARATEQLYARYYDGHTHAADSASEGSNGDEEFSDEDDDDEEEFNPYLFMKSLPPYSSIDPAWTTRICLPPRQPGLAGRNTRAAAAERARRRRVRPGDKKESNMSTTSSSSSSSGVNTSTSSTDEASDALAYSSSGVSGKDESADDDDSNLISLVLDLDETLVHCTVEPIPNADLTFPVLFNGVEYSVHVKFRPHLYDFLNLIHEDGRYEVIVFTASQQVYADELLDRIDPDKKYIHHRMFRESCLPIEGNYLKDLNVLGRDLRRAVLVDNSPHAFGYQVDNGIPIESWFDDPHDTELLKLERFLRTLHDTEDVRDLVRAKFQTRRLIMES